MILKSVAIIVILALILTLLGRWAIGRYTPQAESLYQGGDSLAACPDTPNCVSTTYSDDSHHIAALTGDEKVFNKLKSIVTGQDRVTVITSTEHYLHAEFRTKLLAYVDDLELLHLDGSNRIQMRSASRLGKSDFGVNRKRLQALLKELGSS